MVFLCKSLELENGTCKSFFINNKSFLISNVNNEFFAIEDICTHDGEKLSGGRLLGNDISCPRHGALFDVKSGKVKSLPALYDVKSYKVINKDGDLFIAIEG
ncbi:MAG: Rieske 2Fe-2S domain-containing protein [Dehalococcoidia bacterium]|jgi:3-phenylpropionate/trans-cinnamate dioxygenase ferredoxin subunit|nr:MAG: 3-phenylpropionate/trans-cinnamate dioxygenase ferredoxin subunit [Chloroflexota bacterium]|tara:strand:+ start:2707 stop:3012 length:306 start_codon:yes stop_codon:yes gene_type:complete